MQFVLLILCNLQQCYSSVNHLYTESRSVTQLSHMPVFTVFSFSHLLFSVSFKDRYVRATMSDHDHVTLSSQPRLKPTHLSLSRSLLGLFSSLLIFKIFIAH